MVAFFNKYSMNLKEFDNFNLGDAVHFHDHLNPAIFKGDSMRPEVRTQLLLIAEDFVEHLGIDHLNIEDITISGSSAAYSYTEHSDIDLHIVVDMNNFKDDDVYRELFDAKKVVYNDAHDIVISGFEVELYVQDKNKPVISLGEYSVKDDKWLRLPRKRRANLDQAATKMKYDKLAKLAEFALKSHSYPKIQGVLRTIKKYRQAGLDLNGEFGPENLAYKALRSKGVVSKLYSMLDELHSKRLSLPESKVLDKPELSMDQIAKKHGVDKTHIMSQLMKGVGVESEHTSGEKAAMEIALDHLAEDPNYYSKLEKANLEEAFDKPYPNKWEKSEYGDVDAVVKLPDGTPLTIMFNHEGMDTWQVEFYRNNSQEITGEGDAHRIFATVLNTIQKFVKKYKPKVVKFSATKQVDPGQNSESRAKLYDRLVQRYATSLGYTTDTQNIGNEVVMYQLTRNQQKMSECSGYIPSEKEKNDPRWSRALSVDVRPDAIIKNAKAFGFKVSRAGIPPLLRK